jgi:hypothetical protein
MQNFNVRYQNYVRQKRNLGWVFVEVSIENIFEVTDFKTMRNRSRRMVKLGKRNTVATIEANIL